MCVCLALTLSAECEETAPVTLYPQFCVCVEEVSAGAELSLGLYICVITLHTTRWCSESFNLYLNRQIIKNTSVFTARREGKPLQMGAKKKLKTFQHPRHSCAYLQKAFFTSLTCLSSHCWEVKWANPNLRPSNVLLTSSRLCVTRVKSAILKKEETVNNLRKQHEVGRDVQSACRGVNDMKAQWSGMTDRRV